MQGNIRQRGAASWELRVFVGRDPVTGRERYVTKTVRGGKREAHRELVTLLYAAQQGALSRSTATVADLLNAWFDHARPDLLDQCRRQDTVDAVDDWRLEEGRSRRSNPVFETLD